MHTALIYQQQQKTQFPTVTSDVRKGGKAKYATNGFDSKMCFPPHTFSWSLSGYTDVEAMETRGGISCSQTLFI